MVRLLKLKPILLDNVTKKKKKMICKNLETASDLILRNEMVKISKKLVFCVYQQIKIHCVQAFKPPFYTTTIIFL